jgi:GNAT superfamily N-acetyltransferase
MQVPAIVVYFPANTGFRMDSPSNIANFRIVPATERDVPVLFTMIRELAEYEKLTDKLIATEELLRKNLFGAGNRSVEAHLAYLDDRPVGYAIFFHNFSTFLARPGLYIEDIYVRPETRGKGIGKAMFEYLRGIAKERGCGRMEWSVLKWNKSAIDFYEKMGAVPMDEWTTYRLVLEPNAF